MLYGQDINGTKMSHVIDLATITSPAVRVFTLRVADMQLKLCCLNFAWL